MLAADDLTVGSSYDYQYDNLGRLAQTTTDNGGLPAENRPRALLA